MPFIGYQVISDRFYNIKSLKLFTVCGCEKSSENLEKCPVTILQIATESLCVTVENKHEMLLAIFGSLNVHIALVILSMNFPRDDDQ